jgi:hypothetical protein
MIRKEAPPVGVCMSHLCTKLAIDHSLGGKVKDRAGWLFTENMTVLLPEFGCTSTAVK